MNNTGDININSRLMDEKRYILVGRGEDGLFFSADYPADSRTLPYASTEIAGGYREKNGELKCQAGNFEGIGAIIRRREDVKGVKSGVRRSRVDKSHADVCSFASRLRRILCVMQPYT